MRDKLAEWCERTGFDDPCRYTSHDRAFDILSDWKEERDRFTAEIAAAHQKANHLRAVVQWIAAQENLLFAECTQAEEIVKRCREALNMGGL